MINTCFLLFVSVFLQTNPVAPVQPTHAGIRATKLQCEFKERPVGMDVPQPALGWIDEAISGESGNQFQTAFCIQAASSEKLLKEGKADLWNSGKKNSIACNNIHYNGKPLASGAICYWRVRVWDRNGIPSPWSKISCWRMGLLKTDDWEGRWIKDSRPAPPNDSALFGDLPAPVFRREFSVSGKIKSAFLYISGLGYYEAHINGRRVGNRVLDPGWTDYSKRVFYSSYNVTSLLAGGSNCLGVMLGNGWYNPLPLRMFGRINLLKELTTGPPAFIAQLNITYADGSTISVYSDKHWKLTDGPVIRNNIYLGETDDARKRLPGWDRAGYDDARWRSAAGAEAPAGRLQSQPQPPIIIADTLRPVSIKKRATGNYLVDMGRNFAGIVRLSARGRAGTVIRLTYGELLYPDGSLDKMTAVAGQIKGYGKPVAGAPDTAYARDAFILDGRGENTFQPRFTFHGFRYVEVTGYPGELDETKIQGLVLHADVPDAGSFSCSDPLINQIQQACRNTFLSNLFSVQSDCPHRERFGYGGDILATSEAFMDNFGMAGFYAKTLQDYADAARPDGGLTETAPFVGIADNGLGGQSGPVEWGSVVPVLMNNLYRYYGNEDAIRQHYQTAKNWVDFISRHAPDFLVEKTIGDHESVDPKITGLSATAFYYYNSVLLARFATMLNKEKDAIQYRQLADKIKAAFIKKYLEPGTGNVGIHTEAAQSDALYFDLIPPENRAAALQVLLKDIHETHQDHVATGMFGTKFMLEVLGREGQGRTAYDMVRQKTFPGWGYMMEKGATTLWEHWAFSDNTFSHNHPMFGTVSEWFYRYAAGIRPAEDAVGYNKIIIEPLLTGLQWAKAAYHSVLGDVRSDWHIQDGRFFLNVHIPVNAHALVYIPSTNKPVIRNNANRVLHNGLVPIIKKENGSTVFSVGSGDYSFAVAL